MKFLIYLIKWSNKADLPDTQCQKSLERLRAHDNRFLFEIIIKLREIPRKLLNILASKIKN